MPVCKNCGHDDPHERECTGKWGFSPRTSPFGKCKAGQRIICSHYSNDISCGCHKLEIEKQEAVEASEVLGKRESINASAYQAEERSGEKENY